MVVFGCPCGPGHSLYLLFQKDAAAILDREEIVIIFSMLLISGNKYGKDLNWGKRRIRNGIGT
ncbi:hypothetical protein DRW42_28075 [Pedobacter miscanthi]|uniref:Uncharacterized protein n=1 Tax=Pedobacter miscanthi TaxID=2259170 RepID=A0A366KJT1_9SPHI|nr:hypothetical protein DRW42_28075 [Pedobacter miscanthi]